MCGIFGYYGDDNAKERILSGLKRLEYRGYDSWGIGVLKNNRISVFKKVAGIGEINQEEIDLPTANIGIGHTRWATHGGVNEKNAHPHFSSDGRFILAQNGIVENYYELKEQLQNQGYKFISETDTEVIVGLIEKELKHTPNLLLGTKKAFVKLHGRNTIILLDRDNEEIIAIRNGSPLVIGYSDREKIIASDTLSFSDRVEKIVLLDNFDGVVVNKEGVNVFDIKSDGFKDFSIETIGHKDIKIDKEGFPHFMIKEIVEQKDTIKTAVAYSKEELSPVVEKIKKSRRVFTIGAGTAGFSAQQIAYFLRTISKIDATDLRSYEFKNYLKTIEKDDLLIVVSQSGETADTIEAMEEIKKRGVEVASIVNMLGSTITRNSDYKYFSRSGPEICVASTKAYTAQISWGYLVSKTIINEYDSSIQNIKDLSLKLESYLNDTLFEEIRLLADKIKDNEHFFILGKGQNLVTVLEGSLKIKEITYKHFEGFPAGELKHGVIALIEKGTPVFGVISNDDNRNDMINALTEVKARGAFVITVSNESESFSDITIPSFDGGEIDSIVKIIPFQLLSYFLAIELGNKPDKPRNLAKSVTVK